MKNTKSNILWGIFFILVGIGFTGKALNLWNFSFNLFDGWWTMIIIVPCCISLSNHGPRKMNLIGLVIGLLLLLDQVNIIRGISVFDLFIPIILIVIGVSFFFRNKTANSDFPDHAAEQQFSAVFASKEMNYNHENFNGASVDVCFGGIKIDLRKAVLNTDVKLCLNVILGNANIFVPSNIKVEVQTTKTVGEVCNMVVSDNKSMGPTLYINATCIMGKVKIEGE